jgi:endonuclease YncB( thermonuclease family)
MAKQLAICTRVIAGDALETSTGLVIHLARVIVPKVGAPGGSLAKDRLTAKINGQIISYEVLEKDDFGQCVAEVWVGRLNVNDWMGSLGYDESPRV